MSSYHQTIVDKINENTVAMRAILADPRGEDGQLSAEQNASLEAFDAEFDRLDGERRRIADLETKLSATDALRAHIAPAIVSDEPKRKGRIVAGDEGLVEAIRSAQDAVRNDHGAFEREFELHLDTDRYLKTVGQSRAIADFSDAAALYMNDFSTNVAVYQRTLSPWFAIGTVINADNGRPLVIPNLTVDPSMTTPGEGTAITENSGTLGEATATPVSYKTLSYISAEAEEDEVVGLLQLIAKQQGRQLGFSAGTAITATIVAAATSGATATGLGGGSTATFMGYEDWLDLKYSAAAPYRLNGVWIAALGAIKKARKWTDKNGQYLWQPAIAQGQPDTFDGQPAYEDPGLATPASATKSVLYGDASAVVIKQRGLRVAVSTEYRFNTDQVAIRTVLRAGAALADAKAVSYLLSANA